MSISLNRMSLELVNLETNTKREKKKNQSKNISQFNPVNHKSVENKKKTESLLPYRKSNKIVISQKDKKRLTKKKDSTETKIQRLLLLSSHHIDQNTADKLFNRAVKKQPSLKKNPEEEERTAFTEEDFKNFAEEYFKT